MRLHHYTTFEYLPSILTDGLDTGEVCVTHDRHINGVWLTNSLSPHGLGLTNREDASKLACRIDVDIDRSDPKLRHYKRWARKVGLDPGFMKFLRNAAGAGADDYTWYIYFGTIEPPFVGITKTASGAPITDVSSLPLIRGTRAPGTTRVSLEDVEAGRIDLKFDLAAARLTWAAASAGAIRQRTP
jgi:hypothetical protein